MGFGFRRITRRLRRAIRRIGREVRRGVRDFVRVGRDIFVDSVINPNQDYMKAQMNMQKEAVEKQEADAEQARQEAEEKLKAERENIMGGYEDTSSALGNLGVSEEQTLGGTTSALGVSPVKKKQKKA